MEPGIFHSGWPPGPITGYHPLKAATMAGFIFSFFPLPIFLKMLAILICLVYLYNKYSLL